MMTGSKGFGLGHMKDRQAEARPDRARKVERYWDDLRRGQIVPYRSEVDPRRIEDALSCAFIGERVSAGMARLRIAGTEINDLMGMETRGMPVSALIEPGSRARFSAALRALFAEPAAIRMRLAAPGSLGRPAMSGNLVLLPMRDDMGEITRLLGCLEVAGKVGRCPRRFEIEEVETEVLGPRPLRQEGDVDRREGMAEPPRPFVGAPPSRTGRPTRVPWLRVIDSE